jgi:hypothetical protein
MNNKDIAKLCDMLDTAIASAEQPEVAKLFEFLGVSRSTLREHQIRLHRVDAAKSIARQQPQRAQTVADLKSQLELAESAKASNDSETKHLTQQLAAAEASAPTEESLRVIESLAPQLAQLRNASRELTAEVEMLRTQLASAVTELAACDTALASLSTLELMPLRVKVSIALPAPERNEIVERLRKVVHLITQGRAVLGIETREYRYSAGDRPATGALREFYIGGGVPGCVAVPVLFDESELRLHGGGVMKPIRSQIEQTQAEVRVAVARLQLEECELLRKQGLGEANPLSQVYADEIRNELQVAALI